MLPFPIVSNAVFPTPDNSAVTAVSSSSSVPASLSTEGSHTFPTSILHPIGTLWQRKVCFAEMPPQDASVVFQGSSEEACDLTQGMLRLDPLRRISALEALQHRYEVPFSAVTVSVLSEGGLSVR